MWCSNLLPDQGSGPPHKPTDKSFGELVKLVKYCHQPPPLVIVQRLNFNTLAQKEGETVLEFIAGLHRLLEHCKYKAKLDNMLRDRLICGLQDQCFHHQLFAETFKKNFRNFKKCTSCRSFCMICQRPPNSPSNLKHYWPLQNKLHAINNLNDSGSIAKGVMDSISIKTADLKMLNVITATKKRTLQKFAVPEQKLENSRNLSQPTRYQRGRQSS